MKQHIKILANIIIALTVSLPMYATYFLTDPYLQHLTPTGVTIVWVADDAIGQMGYVRYRAKGESYRTAVDTDRGMVKAFNRINKIRLTGLKPDTEYAYYVVERAIRDITDTSLQYTDSVVSSIYKFTTPKEQAKEVSCKIFNDIHNYHNLFTRMMGYPIMQNYDFVVFNGDMLNATPSETDIISNIIKPCTKLFASSKPLIAPRGNHENRREFARKYFDYFQLGDNNLGYYAFTWGPVYFIILDSGEDSEDIDPANLWAGDIQRRMQQNWLEEALQTEEKKNALYTVVIKHIPTYTNTSKERHGMIYERELYQPLFHKYGIDALISGHTHIPGIYPSDSDHHYPLIIGGGNNTTEGASDYSTMITLHATQYALEINMYNLEGNKVNGITIPNTNNLPALEGELLTLRVGDGTAALNTSSAQPLFIDHYHLNERQASLINTTPLPTTKDGENYRCVGTGTPLSSNFITRSANGRYVIVGGYDAEIGSKPISMSAKDANRVVAIVDDEYNVNTTTALSNAFDKSEFRCAASIDGNTIFVSGAGEEDNNGGVLQTTIGSNIATIVKSAPRNSKNIKFVDNSLYVVSNNSILNQDFNSFLPTTPSATDALDFCIVNTNSTANEKVLYWISGVNSISKYSLVNGKWIYNSTYSDLQRPHALEARVVDDCIQLFIISATNVAAGASRLSLIEDTGGYNAELQGLLTTLAEVSGEKKSLRGICWCPSNAMTGNENVFNHTNNKSATKKLLINGHLYIQLSGSIYDVLGQQYK